MFVGRLKVCDVTAGGVILESLGHTFNLVVLPDEICTNSSKILLSQILLFVTANNVDGIQ